MSDYSRARHVVAASFLGWALDAFDFFIMVFLFDDVAAEFGVKRSDVAFAVTLTLAMRAAGAFIFGRLADRYGRRPILMCSVLSYSVLELATGFAPTLTAFILLRGAFGIAMGGEWGIGASLTMESIPPRWRGTVSGLLQAGYPAGYLLATIVFREFHSIVGWRGMFMIGALPALLVLYIRTSVPESPEWVARKASATMANPALDSSQEPVSRGFFATLGHSLPLTIYAVLMMMGFNFFSHGSQDMYPTFLRELKFNDHTLTNIAIIYNIGAMVGGLLFGTLSQFIGRRAGIILACLCALPIIRFWAFPGDVPSPYALAISSFLMQVCVQGAWGIVPAYLNELSPTSIRATFPGLVYQLGNFLASANATIQSKSAEALGNHYSYPLATTIGIVAVMLAVMVIFGPGVRTNEKLGEDLEKRYIPFLPMIGTLFLIAGSVSAYVAFEISTTVGPQIALFIGLAGFTAFLSGIVLVSAGGIVATLRRPVV